MTTSIALTTYNGELYLQEQLDSILNQTIKPDEVIISDDNSTDDTIQIVQEFKRVAPFKVDILINKGLGFNKNFENALYNTSKDIVFICDQDDVWFDNKIEQIINYFKYHEDKELVIHDLEFCDSELNKINQTKIQRFKIKNKTLNNYHTGMATAVRNRFLKTCLPISTATNYDTWIHLCSSLLNVRGVHNKVLSYYRRHEENATKLNPMNAPYKISLYHLLLGSLRKNSFSSLQNELILINDLESYITKQKDNLLYINANFDKIKNELKKTHSHSLIRNSFIQQNFFKRLPKAILLYYDGGYKDKSGFLTMLKDVFAVSKN